MFLAEQTNQTSEVMDIRSTRSKSKGSTIKDNITEEEVKAELESLSLCIEPTNVIDPDTNEADSSSGNSAPTIMQPVVRLQRISSEVCQKPH